MSIFSDEFYDSLFSMPDPLRDYERAMGVGFEKKLKNRAHIQDRLDLLEEMSRGPMRHSDADTWVVSPSRFSEPVRLLIPAIAPEGVLAVRRIVLGGGGYPYFDRSTVEANPPNRLGDVPTPFSVGMLDADVVVAARDPIAVSALNERGIRACSLASPSATLGSLEALRQLVGLGALSERMRPKGSLILVDPGQELSGAGGALLRSFFAEVIEMVAWEDEEFVFTIAMWHSMKRGNLSEWLLREARTGGRVVLVPPSRLPPESAPSLTMEERGFVNVGDIVARSEVAVDWVIPGIAAAGAVTDLAGEPKTGKSTFLLDAARSLVEGLDFMGQPCSPGAVIYVTEQTESVMGATLHQMGWSTQGEMYAMTFEGHSSLGYDELLARISATAEEVQARLVVIDTFPAVSKLGSDLNSAGAVRYAFRKLRKLCELGAAVVLTRHTTKQTSGNHNVSVAQAGAGSHAISAEVDHLVLYTAVDGSGSGRRRQVETKGRFSPPETFQVEWSGASIVRCAPMESEGETPGATVKRKSRPSVQEDAVLRAIGESAGEPLGVKQILSRIRQGNDTKMKEGSIRATLDRLVKEGAVVRDRSGRKHLFALPPGTQHVPSSSSVALDDDES